MERMTNRRSTIDVNGITIAYQEQGTGFPVIFLHGGTLDSDHWSKNLPATAARYRAIAYDRRNCGDSTHGVPDSPEAWAEDLRQIILTLAAGRAIVVGSSFGGLTVMEGLVRYPELIEAAVISATRGSGFASPQPPEIVFGNRLPDLAQVTQPVRVIHGADDTGCPPELGRAVADAIPGADFVLVPNAGHSVHRHQPDAFNTALLEFLDGLHLPAH